MDVSETHHHNKSPSYRVVQTGRTGELETPLEKTKDIMVI
jgi:hypothetical protein